MFYEETGRECRLLDSIYTNFTQCSLPLPKAITPVTPRAQSNSPPCCAIESTTWPMLLHFYFELSYIAIMGWCNLTVKVQFLYWSFYCCLGHKCFLTWNLTPNTFQWKRRQEEHGIQFMCRTCRERHLRRQGKGITAAEATSVLTTASFPSLGEGPEHRQMLEKRWQLTSSDWGICCAPNTSHPTVKLNPCSHRKVHFRTKLYLCFHNKAMWYPQPQKQPPQSRRWMCDSI